MGGVEVAVLDPAVADQHVVAPPPRLGRGRGRETEPHLVAGVHDHVAIVHPGQQLADVAEPGVEPDEVAPPRTMVGDLVVRQLEAARPQQLRPRVAAVPEVGDGGGQPRLAPQIRLQPRGLGDPVPVDLEVGPQAQAPRPPPVREPGHVDDHRLELASGEAQIGVHHHPAPLRVQGLHGHPAGNGVLPLAEGHVDAAVGGIDPAVGEQRHRIPRLHDLVELQLQIVGLRDALVGALVERRHVAVVPLRHELAHVGAGVVPDPGHGARGAGHDGVERHRVAGEPLVHPDLGVRRMVHHQQGHVVEEVRLPQIRGDPQVVLAVHRGQ